MYLRPLTNSVPNFSYGVFLFRKHVSLTGYYLYKVQIFVFLMIKTSFFQICFFRIYFFWQSVSSESFSLCYFVV